MADLEGFDELKKQLEKLGEQTRLKLSRALHAGGNAIVTKARANVPVNTGHLKRSIISTSTIVGIDVLEVVIGSTVNYASYVEFGTLPHKSDKGHKEFVDSLKEWCKKKGFPWFPIWRHIVKSGTKPKPFLIPAYNQVAPKVYAKLEQIIKEA